MYYLEGIIKGEKKMLPPCKLEMGYTLLFEIQGDESITRHLNKPERKNRLSYSVGWERQSTSKDVSEEENESRLIASHGGGLHFQVDISDTETLLRVLNRIADYKLGGQCALEMNNSGLGQ